MDARLQDGVPAPSSRDWEIYRPIIIEFYIARHMSLPRVMEQMQLQFGFHATAKMYKARFTRWGVKKNVNADRLVAALQNDSRKRLSSDAEHAPIDSKALKKYVHRLPEGKRKELMDTILRPLGAGASIVGLEPMHSIRTPKNLQLPEQCIFQLQGYVTGSAEGNRWQYDEDGAFKNEDIIPAWCSSVMNAHWVLAENKPGEANMFLNEFVRQSPEQLGRQDPLLFPFIYTSILFFAKDRPPIAAALLFQLWKIAQSLAVDNASHPLKQILDLLYQMGPEDMLNHGDKILLAYVSMIHRALGKAYPLVQDMLSDTMGRLLTHGLSSPAEVADVGKRMVLAAEMQDQDRSEYHLRLKMSLSSAYRMMGNYSAAREIIEDILSAKNDDLHYERMVPTLYMTHCQLNETEGRQDEAIESSLRALVSSINIFGQFSDWAVNSMILYRRMLEKGGRLDEAQKVEQDRDVVIQELLNRKSNG